VAQECQDLLAILEAPRTHVKSVDSAAHQRFWVEGWVPCSYEEVAEDNFKHVRIGCGTSALVGVRVRILACCDGRCMCHWLRESRACRYRKMRSFGALSWTDDEVESCRVAGSLEGTSGTREHVRDDALDLGALTSFG
jgi:hypothetical protein